MKKLLVTRKRGAYSIVCDINAGSFNIIREYATFNQLLFKWTKDSRLINKIFVDITKNL